MSKARAVGRVARSYLSSSTYGDVSGLWTLARGGVDVDASG